MINLKKKIENLLLKSYDFFLNKKIFVILKFLDILLPNVNIDYPKKIHHRTSVIKENIDPSFKVEIDSILSKVDKINLEIKILVILPSTETNLLYYTFLNLVSSTKKIDGIEFLVIARDGTVVYPADKEGCRFSEGDLRQQNFKYIFFEIHTFFKSYQDANFLSMDYIKKFKFINNAKVIGFCFDLWRDFDFKFIEYWWNAVDFFIHMDNESIRNRGVADDNFIFWPFAGWVNNTAPVIKKNKLLFFQGNIKNSDRRKAVTTAARVSNKVGLVSKFVTFNYNSISGIPKHGDYFKNLSEAQFTLGLSQKSNEHCLITFRSLEAISVGSTLLQQELEGFSALGEMFKPYEHFLPFRSMDELEKLIADISIRNSEYFNIGDTARKYMRENYSPERMWRYLFEVINYRIKNTDL